MKKIFWIIGGSILLVGAITFGSYFAGPLLASAHTGQSNAGTPTPTTTPNPYCQQYLQDLAKRLGVSVSTLQQDSLAAGQDMLAQMVKDGKLTQSQANAIKQKVQSHQACTGRGNFLEWGAIYSSLRQYRPSIENQVAQGLHLTSAQLTTDLKNGQSLDQVASPGCFDIPVAHHRVERHPERCEPGCQRWQPDANAGQRFDAGATTATRHPGSHPRSEWGRDAIEDPFLFLSPPPAKRVGTIDDTVRPFLPICEVLDSQHPDARKPGHQLPTRATSRSTLDPYCNRH